MPGSISRRLMIDALCQKEKYNGLTDRNSQIGSVWLALHADRCVAEACKGAYLASLDALRSTRIAAPEHYAHYRFDCYGPVCRIRAFWTASSSAIRGQPQDIGATFATIRGK